MESEVFFVELTLDLKRPSIISNVDGTPTDETLRRFSVSLPIRDKERAEQMMDHLAKGLADAFKEVEQHANAEREAVKAVSRDGGGEARPGDELQIHLDPSATQPGPGGEGRCTVGSVIPPRIDVPRIAEHSGEEEKERVE